jgi:hypothetical protein
MLSQHNVLLPREVGLALGFVMTPPGTCVQMVWLKLGTSL